MTHHFQILSMRSQCDKYIYNRGECMIIVLSIIVHVLLSCYSTSGHDITLWITLGTSLNEFTWSFDMVSWHE